MMDRGGAWERKWSLGKGFSKEFFGERGFFCLIVIICPMIIISLLVENGEYKQSVCKG